MKAQGTNDGVFFTALKGTILFLMFAAVVFAAPSPKSASDYWRDTGLTWGRVAGELTNAHCDSNFASYLGCVEGARSVMKRLGLGVDLASTPNAKKVVEVVAGFDLVAANATTLVPLASDSAAQKLRLIRAQQVAAKNFWKVRFSLDSGSDFAALWKWLGERIPKALESEVAAAAYNGYLKEANDPASRIEPQAMIDDENDRKSDEHVGIGILVAALGNEIVIRRVTPGSPAEKAGLHVLDSLIAVNGKSIVGLNWDAINQQLKSVEGTELKLTVFRGRGSKTFAVKAVKLTSKKVESEWLGTKETASSYGYVRLRDFAGLSNCEDTDHAVKQFQRGGARGLILDLRGNPGGRINDARCIANSFLPERMHVFSVLPLPDQAGFSYYGATAVAATTSLPLITLIDSQSASASELLSGALQDWARTLVVGDRSFGKGTVQSPQPWTKDLAKPDDKSIAYYQTTGLFYLPSGRSLQLAGVTPDLRAVYASANPTDDEKLALRQEDLSLNPVQPPPSPKRTARDFTGVQACVDKGNAAKLKSGKGGDFTLLTAQTALDCWQNHPELRWEIVSGPDL